MSCKHAVHPVEEINHMSTSAVVANPIKITNTDDTYTIGKNAMGKRWAYNNPNNRFLTQYVRQMVKLWATERVGDSRTIYLDTETTGVDEQSEVIELSILDYRGERLFSQRFKPSRPLTEDAIRIHGITNEMLANEKPFSSYWDEITHLMDNKVVIAYNADYDRRLLIQTAQRFGLTPPPSYTRPDWHCAMIAFTIYQNSGKWYKLADASNRLGLGNFNAHSAGGDTEATYEVVHALAEQDPFEWDETKSSLDWGVLNHLNTAILSGEKILFNYRYKAGSAKSPHSLLPLALVKSVDGEFFLFGQNTAGQIKNYRLDNVEDIFIAKQSYKLD